MVCELKRGCFNELQAGKVEDRIEHLGFSSELLRVTARLISESAFQVCQGLGVYDRGDKTFLLDVSSIFILFCIRSEMLHRRKHIFSCTYFIEGYPFCPCQTNNPLELFSTSPLENIIINIHINIHSCILCFLKYEK